MSDLDKAAEKAQVKLAREALSQQLGISVGSGYGYPERTKTVCVPGKSDIPQWFLIVWSNKEVSGMPKTFQGYKVVRRDIPIAAPALGTVK